MEVLVINGHDYSRYVARKGLGWSRNDLDGENTTRTKDGTLRRDKITTKRKVGYTVIATEQSLLAQLDTDLSGDTFTATYLDLHGVQTREFYCTSFSATASDVIDGSAMWDGAQFNMIEV